MDPVKNFAYGVIQTSPLPATTGTSFVLTSGQGANFPDPSVSGAYNVVVWPANVSPTQPTLPTNQNAEIVRVTARTSDTFTITRAQESTSAQQIVAGYQVALVPTAKTITDIQNEITALPSFPLSVGNGGTGATTAAAARTNLGAEAQSVNLDTWSGKTPPTGAVLGTTDTQVVTHKDLTDPTNTVPIQTFNAYHVESLAQQNITNTSFADMTGMTQSIVLAVKSHVFIFGRTVAKNTNAGSYVYLEAVYNDGADHKIGGDDYTPDATEKGLTVGGFKLNLAAGTYTFKLQNRVSANTGNYWETSMDIFILPAP